MLPYAVSSLLRVAPRKLKIKQALRRSRKISSKPAAGHLQLHFALLVQRVHSQPPWFRCICNTIWSALQQAAPLETRIRGCSCS